MLKIKDNVDLKKIGCDMDEDDYIWSYKELLFDRETRIIDEAQFFGDNKHLRIDALYDLIKADLVENMNAKEMFEELGFYEQRVDDRYKDKIIMYSNSFAEVVITFYLDIKQIAIDSLKDGQGKRYELDYKIFQAVNKQIGELGWK